jgi:hypothetical protein
MIDLLAEEIANKLVTDRSKLIEVITLALWHEIYPVRKTRVAKPKTKPKAKIKAKTVKTKVKIPVKPIENENS